MKKLLLLAVAAVLSGCGEPDLTKANFNVYYQVGYEGRFIGTAKGLDQCAVMAKSQAQIEGLLGTNRWGYVCCLITSDSSCESKHR